MHIVQTAERLKYPSLLHHVCTSNFVLQYNLGDGEKEEEREYNGEFGGKFVS